SMQSIHKTTAWRITDGNMAYETNATKVLRH
ncbi:hypothetical protein DBR06_SOUSAS5110033, partial [Sousa chinensis]